MNKKSKPMQLMFLVLLFDFGMVLHLPCPQAQHDTFTAFRVVMRLSNPAIDSRSALLDVCDHVCYNPKIKYKNRT